jgi:translation initiation factor IF-2
MLPKKYEQRSLGRLVVRQTFKVSRRGTIAGCFVTEGVVNRDAHLRLLRNNIILRDNVEVESLRRFKDDVREVRAGFECGLKIKDFDDVKVDDAIEAYEEVEVERTL